jgi:hypothetical protein
VSDRKIAELDEIVESVPRDRVRQILGPVVARGSTAGTLIGGWLGFAIGAVPALGGAPAVVGWLVALKGLLGRLMRLLGRRSIAAAHRRHMESFKRFAEGRASDAAG